MRITYMSATYVRLKRLARRSTVYLLGWHGGTCALTVAGAAGAAGLELKEHQDKKVL